MLSMALLSHAGDGIATLAMVRCRYRVMLAMALLK
jgi:hypothetical protein